jgi:hypothetical protein
MKPSGMAPDNFCATFIPLLQRAAPHQRSLFRVVQALLVTNCFLGQHPAHGALH